MGDGKMNLKLSRGTKSVWDEPGWQDALSRYDKQRWLTAAAGVVLALGGVRRGGAGGGLVAAAGTLLAVRAAMGRHDFGLARNWIDSRLTDWGWREHDRVHDASEESFPASDSPSWTATTGASRN